MMMKMNGTCSQGAVDTSKTITLTLFWQYNSGLWRYIDRLLKKYRFITLFYLLLDKSKN